MIIYGQNWSHKHTKKELSEGQCVTYWINLQEVGSPQCFSTKFYIVALKLMGKDCFEEWRNLYWCAMSQSGHCSLDIYHGPFQHDFGYNTIKSWTPNYFQKISVGLSRHKKVIYFCSHQKTAIENTGFIQIWLYFNQNIQFSWIK